MSLTFHKLHGLGNDFMLVDSAEQPLQANQDEIRAWGDRRTGIGFDQLLYLRRAAEGVSVTIYNADGSQAEQCGNGMRAIALWLSMQGQLTTPRSLITAGGELTIGQQPNTPGHFFVDFPTPVLYPSITDQQQRFTQAYPVSVGNPHLVIFCDQPGTERQRHGQALATDTQLFAQRADLSSFQQGCNIGFAKADGAQLELHVWERGAGPTRACGSGACAAAWVILQTQSLQQVEVTQPGGTLVLEYSGAHYLRMSGPAQYVYTGTIPITH